MGSASRKMADPSNKGSQTADAMAAAHKSLCLIEDVSAPEDERPELATNKEWRDEMRRVRKSLSMSQQVLADAIDADQGDISKIETGEVGSSKYILPICKALGIEPPEHFVDENSRLWIRMLEAVRASDRPLAKAILENIKAFNDELEAERQRLSEPPPAEKPKK